MLVRLRALPTSRSDSAAEAGNCMFISACASGDRLGSPPVCAPVVTEPPGMVGSCAGGLDGELPWLSAGGRTLRTAYSPCWQPCSGWQPASQPWQASTHSIVSASQRTSSLPSLSVARRLFWSVTWKKGVNGPKTRSSLQRKKRRKEACHTNGPASITASQSRLKAGSMQGAPLGQLSSTSQSMQRLSSHHCRGSPPVHSPLTGSQVWHSEAHGSQGSVPSE
mmetsp:Transcript_35904/g.90096  ORF Transcript_35904/g.90096 Transcript_35904/m.90096 type:complete len:222 (+) Transcript_35904:250-915(+)